ncbi:MAG TPA: adenylate/guanylate cyclase domain-containing protein, partial [Kofleriaceae bacterium]|nr:adenylate/guanylate cyclase domain-containing protein [Kofleriaceae bacterium]
MRFDPSAHAARAEHALVVVFLDLKGFAAQSARVTDAEIATQLDAYYAKVTARVTAAGGHVVKFIGDGALVVFHRASADAAVQACLDLKHDLDAWLADLGWRCELIAKVHAGDVIVGPFGGTL